MKYGLGHLSVVPCRAEPSDSSEQVTQLLFGETIKVYEKKTAVLAEYYNQQNKLATVNGSGSIDEITERIYSVVDN